MKLKSNFTDLLQKADSTKVSTACDAGMIATVISLCLGVNIELNAKRNGS
jgi:hypothetical protein